MTLDADGRLAYHLWIQAPSGLLELTAAPYDLDDQAMAEAAVSMRQRTVEADWVEGTFVLSSVRANVLENVNVYVEADTVSDWQTAKDALRESFEQLSYLLIERWENVERRFTCMPANYTMQSSGPMRFATMGKISAQVPRLPGEIMTFIDPSIPPTLDLPDPVDPGGGDGGGGGGDIGDGGSGLPGDGVGAPTVWTP